MPSFRDYRDYLNANTSETENLHQFDLDQSHQVFSRGASLRSFSRPCRGPFAQAVARKPGGGFGSGLPAARPARSRTRSPSCSSANSQLQRHDVRILATDIDTDVLTKAAHGEFAPASIDEVPRKNIVVLLRAAGKDRPTDGHGRGSPVADRVSAAQSDGAVAVQGLFDAIFCRNVMIYFDGPTKTDLIERFTRAAQARRLALYRPFRIPDRSHPGLELVGRTTYRRVNERRRRVRTKSAVATDGENLGLAPGGDSSTPCRAAWMVKVFPGEYYVTRRPTKCC